MSHVVTDAARRRGFRLDASSTDCYVPAIDTVYGDYDIGFDPDHLSEVNDGPAAGEYLPFATWSTRPIDPSDTDRFEHELLHCEFQKSTWWWVRIFIANYNATVTFAKLLLEFVENGLGEPELERFATLIMYERSMLRLVKCWEPLEEAMMEIYRAGFKSTTPEQVLEGPIDKRTFKLHALTSEVDDLDQDIAALRTADGIDDPVLAAHEDIRRIVQAESDEIRDCPISLLWCYPAMTYADMFEGRRAWEICRAYTERQLLHWAQTVYAECGRAAVMLFGVLDTVSANPVLNWPAPAGVNVPTNRFIEALSFIVSNVDYYRGKLVRFMDSVGCENYADLLHEADAMERVFDRLKDEILQLVAGLGFRGTVASPNTFLRSYRTDLARVSRVGLDPHEMSLFEGLDAFRVTRSPSYFENPDEDSVVDVAFLQEGDIDRTAIRGLTLTNTLVKWEFIDAFERGVTLDLESIDALPARIPGPHEEGTPGLLSFTHADSDDIDRLFSGLRGRRDEAIAEIERAMHRGPPWYANPVKRPHPNFDLTAWVDQGRPLPLPRIPGARR